MKGLTTTLLCVLLFFSVAASLTFAANPTEPSSVPNVNCLALPKHPLCQMQAENQANTSGANVKGIKSLPETSQVKRKIVRINRTAKQLSAGGQQASDNVDHSDFILLAQGCHCISPNCVAYSCPADAEVP